MKKLYSLTVVVLLCISSIQSQVTNEGQPVSWTQANLKSTSSIQMEPVDMVAIQKEDQINDANRTKPWRFGYEFNVNLGINNAGTWDNLPNGDRVWRINIQSQGAKSLNFVFDQYKLPTGAMVYLYNNDRTDILGAYTDVMNNKDQMLGTWIVEGDNVWIEYYEPKDVAGQGLLNIGKVIHGYRMKTRSEILAKDLNDSGDCQYDVDCSIGSDFDPLKDRLKHSIAMVIMQGSVCSGQLINNTNNDQTPYFLTSNSCNQGATSTWAFRFNWISPDPVCGSVENSTDTSINQTTSGATNLVNNASSDLRLLQLTGGLDASWDLEWAGWDRTDNAPDFAVGIHHPNGDIMKVSRENDRVSKSFYGGAQVWRVNNETGGWEIGVTDPSSSGSALFDENGRIVGQLFVGVFSFCSGTTDNDSWDVYGRFATSWADNDIAQWLDPSGTGATTLNMYSQVLSTEEPQIFGQLEVFPNPSDGFLFVNNKTNADINYTVYSILGKVLKSGTIPQRNEEVDLSSLNNGVYMIQLQQNNTIITKKIIISK